MIVSSANELVPVSIQLRDGEVHNSMDSLVCSVGYSLLLVSSTNKTSLRTVYRRISSDIKECGLCLWENGWAKIYAPFFAFHVQVCIAEQRSSTPSIQ
jgi:hypothetical protein